MRLDKYLITKGKSTSRQRAKALISEGGVLVNGKIIRKASYEVMNDDVVEVKGREIPWVSRAALKLEKAFVAWDIDVSGLVCVDIGASTGGFTEVLLSHGVKKVYAIDVGHDQLHKKLVQDVRVVNKEGVHIKDVVVEDFNEAIDCIVADVSFISLEKILPKVHTLLSSKGFFVALIKPQFEVGKDGTKKGIVSDPKKHIQVIEQIKNHVCELGFVVEGVIESPICGGDGNKEFLLYARR
jgi:23S rRNA (cytidine1920-2'-O)/16S rRNA (cytidine1409-2'-O)-methyltransferase